MDLTAKVLFGLDIQSIVAQWLPQAESSVVAGNGSVDYLEDPISDS